MAHRVIVTFVATRAYHPARDGNHKTSFQQMTAALIDYFPRLIESLDDPYLDSAGITKEDVYVGRRYAWRSEIIGEGLIIRVHFRGRPPGSTTKKALNDLLSEAIQTWAKLRGTSPTPQIILDSPFWGG